MDEFEFNDSLDTSFSDDDSLDLLEASEDAFDAMDSAEAPTMEDTSFDSIEGGNIEDYSYGNTELFNDEVSDVMNGVEVEELAFDDEPIEDTSAVEVLETEIDQPIEESLLDLIETMDDVETEVLEFDDRLEGPYEVTPNSEIEILQEDGAVDTLENIQEQLEAESEVVEQVEEPYAATVDSEIEILQGDETVDTLENIQGQLEAEPEVVEQIEEPYVARPNAEIEILQENETVDTLGNLQGQLEAESEVAEQVEELYEAIADSEIEMLEEDGTVDTLEDTQEQFGIESEALEQVEDITSDFENQIENTSSVEEVRQIRNQILQEGIHEQESIETDIESQVENVTSAEDLTQIQNQILQEEIPEKDASGYEEFATEEYVEDPPKTLTREIIPEILESRNADTEEVLENYRENLREYGVDEDAIEQYVSQERDKINAEYESLDRGDLDSNHYEVPTDWEGIASGLKEDGPEDTNFEENIDPTVTEIESIDPSEIDYDEVFEGLDSYDFDGVDYLQDAERLDDSLSAFQPERWKELDLNQQKEAMTELADYVQEVICLENPPTIEFYNNPVDGDYGGYMASTNTLSINEYMLYDSNEAADTVAHELWHAYQHEHAMNPQSPKDYQYQYNFDHYISPKQDMSGRFVNFTEYQEQLVEAEARAFAEQFKGRLGGYSGAD